MRQKVRRFIIFIWFFLFPVTLNFFSPYVSIDGAMLGLISGSVIVFFLMFLSGLFFSRAWCAWICPASALAEIARTINDKPVQGKTFKIIRYSIFSVWFGILVLGFILSGGIKGISPLHLTENVISVDAPVKYIVYYFVLFAFFGLSVIIGRRGACHTICWMSPFLVAGYHLGRILRLPQLRITANSGDCIDCRKCDKICPMSISVNSLARTGEITSSDCILCCECADACPKAVLAPKMTRGKKGPPM